MILNKPIFSVLILSACHIACNVGDASRSIAEKKAEEQRQRNPVKKGRYECYKISTEGDEAAPELFILSDNIYQVDDVTGKYAYDHQRNSIQINDGPLNQEPGKWIGFYKAKGTATPGGGKTLESMIEFRKQSDIDSGNQKVVMQCNCTELE